MDKVKVSIVRAHDYERTELIPTIERSLTLIGGVDSIVKPGSKVFVKINHLSPPSEADKGIVTHPVFVEAVLELLKEAGAEITVGDDISSDTGDGFLISGVRQMCKRAGLGNEPRKVFDEVAQIKAVDVVMPTRYGTSIRKRCIAQPTKAQAVLLQRLDLHLPQRMKIHENVV